MTEVIEVPLWDEEVKTSLFYNKMDYYDFQEAEQRRYNKMMSKQIQKMVYEKMGPQLQEAIDRGASAEEIEAIMPQTTEEIFALLGTIPDPEMPAILKSDVSERGTNAFSGEIYDKKNQEKGLFVGDENTIGQLEEPVEPKSPQLLANVVSDSGDVEVRRDVATRSEVIIEEDRVSKALVTAARYASDDEIYALFHVDESSAATEADRRNVFVDCKVAVRERGLVDMGHPSFEYPTEMEVASFNGESSATQPGVKSTTKLDETDLPYVESSERQSDNDKLDLHRTEESAESFGNSATDERPITQSSTIPQARPSSSEARLQTLRSKLIRLTEGYDHM